MKNKLINNYFSKIAFIFFAIVFCLTISRNVNAQIMSYGGKQIMYFPEAICNGAPQINVHFILQGDSIVSLYSVPGATRTYGLATVEFGVSQVGTYFLAPMPCMVIIGTGEVPIWLTEGIYIDAATGFSLMKEKFFAGTVDPFVKIVDTKA